MSMRRRPARRRMLRLACVAPFAVAAGCVSIGSETPMIVSYELRDLGEPKPPAARPLDRVVLVAWSAASVFYDSTSIAYSRTPGALANYQFAAWSERPAEQIGRLFLRRLAGTGVFRDVAPVSGIVQGDWLLELQLEEMLHDDAAPPGVARVAVFARIVDRSARSTIDTRHFREEEPLQVESAAGAAKAFDAAVTRLLDEAVQWAVDRASGARSQAARPSATGAARAAVR